MPPQDELADIGNPEEGPSEDDDGEHVDVLQDARQPLDELAEEQLLADEKRAVVDAPEHEVPCRSMPKARDGPDHRNVEDPAGSRDAASAQWDVEVVAEERRQRDVPAPPELGDRPRDVGVVEVAQVLEAHHATKSDGHVRVSREVEVDLEGVGDDAGPGTDGADLRTALLEHEIGENGHGVGEQRFLCETDDEEAKPAREVGEVLLATRYLFGDGLVAHDGAGDELREARDVHSEEQDVSLRGDLAAIDVDDVGERLKGVERYADGKRKVQIRRQHRGQCVVDDACEEALVLEEADDEQVEDDGYSKYRLALCSEAGGICLVRRIS